MKGYFQRLLRIDLSAKSCSYENIPDPLLAEVLGGKGLGTRLMTAEIPKNADPLAPENCLIIATGPLTGTSMWGQSRFAVFSKSPATGGYGESYCGGTLAPKIKGCGIDAVIIQGKAPTLTYVTINEQGAEFHDAPDLRGAETYTAEREILANSPSGSSAMVIGPAGEKLARLACIKSDRWRSLGRGGMGAVMGSKNLKGITFAGSKRAAIADKKLLAEVIRGVARKARGSAAAETYVKFGTSSVVGVTNSQNCFPTRYWKSGHFAGWERLSADYMLEHFEVRNHGCPNCFLQCTKRTVIREGRHKGLEIEGPEYETIYALGGLNCIDSLEEVAYLNDICDRLGIDTISAGNLAAFAVEAFQRGKSDFPIEYNQPDRVAELFRMIAAREGIGDLLAQGIREAAEVLGLEDIAVHVKGLEPAGFDPRVLKGMGLSYATAARGACHLRGTFYKAELSGQIDKDTIQGKAALHIDYEDRAALFDCLILCRFFRDFLFWEEIGTLIEAATGKILSKQELEGISNRITEDTRRFNLREGIGPGDDTLPPRLLKEATQEGSSLSPSDLGIMIGEYNRLRKRRDD